MATIVRYDPVTSRIVDRIVNQDPAVWGSVPGVLIDPNESPVSHLQPQFWRVDTATLALRPATQAEIDSATASDEENRRIVSRQTAISLLQSTEAGDSLAVIIRALLRVITQEFTRVQGGQAPRTALQLWVALRTVISSGQGDGSL